LNSLKKKPNNTTYFVIIQNNEVIYTLNRSSSGNQIQILCSQEIKNSTFQSDESEGLKNLFQKVISSQTEKIVLKRL
jgi:hypothetical protein